MMKIVFALIVAFAATFAHGVRPGSHSEMNPPALARFADEGSSMAAFLQLASPKCTILMYEDTNFEGEETKRTTTDVNGEEFMANGGKEDFDGSGISSFIISGCASVELYDDDMGGCKKGFGDNIKVNGDAQGIARNPEIKWDLDDDICGVFLKALPPAPCDPESGPELGRCPMARCKNPSDDTCEQKQEYTQGKDGSCCKKMCNFVKKSDGSKCEIKTKEKIELKPTTLPCDPESGPELGRCPMARCKNPFDDTCEQKQEYKQGKDGSCCKKMCNFVKKSDGSKCEIKTKEKIQLKQNKNKLPEDLTGGWEVVTPIIEDELDSEDSAVFAG